MRTTASTIHISSSNLSVRSTLNNMIIFQWVPIDLSCIEIVEKFKKLYYKKQKEKKNHIHYFSLNFGIAKANKWDKLVSTTNRNFLKIKSTSVQ